MTPTQLISLAIVALLIFWAVGAYNRLVRLRNTIANAFGQIDVQLKRRYDLIPNLVEAAKKYLSHERVTMEAVINARNQAKNASDAVRSRPVSALAVTTLAVAEQALIIRELSEELTSNENNVTFARQAFNDAVLDYNNAQGQFPAVLIAKIFSFAPSAMLQATESVEERKGVRVQM